MGFPLNERPHDRANKDEVRKSVQALYDYLSEYEKSYPLIPRVIPTEPAEWSNTPKASEFKKGEWRIVNEPNQVDDSLTVIEVFSGRGWDRMTKAHYAKYFAPSNHENESTGIQPTPAEVD